MGWISCSSSSPSDAQRVANYLQRAGFAVLPVKPAAAPLTKSTILWQAQSKEEKELVASYLTLVPTRRDPKYATGASVTVVIAPDFQGIEGI
jgi:hypothetical protein